MQNIMDHISMMNIMPFGMCMSIANPTVAAATAAALGVLTPMPCIPATTSPWVPGAPNVLLGNQPTLDNVDVDVHVGRGDHIRDSGRVHGDGAVRRPFSDQLP